MMRAQDFIGTDVVGSDVALVGRYDTSVKDISVSGSEKKLLKGIIVKTADAGELIVRQNQTVIALLALESLIVAAGLVALEADINADGPVSFAVRSSSGTGATIVTALFDKS